VRSSHLLSTARPLKQSSEKRLSQYLAQHEFSRHARRGLSLGVDARFHVELPYLLPVAHFVAPPPFLPRQAHPPQRLQQLQCTHVAAAASLASAMVGVAARFAQQRGAHHGLVRASGGLANRSQGGHCSPPRVAALFLGRSASTAATALRGTVVAVVAILVAAAAKLYFGVSALAGLVAVLPVQKHVHYRGWC